jgi:hypothetical protein
VKMSFVLAVGLAWSISAAGHARAQPRDDDDEPTTMSFALTEVDPTKPPDDTRSTSARALDAALQRYAREPRVEQVVQVALLAAPPSRSDALAARARTAGWIPRIGLRARRGQTIDLSSAANVDSDDLRLKSNDDLTLEATLSFELDRVVFRPEEVALARQHRIEHDDRSALVRDVVHLYFERRRLQLERDLSDRIRPEHELRIAEIEALLDAFTNGAFRRMITATRWTTGAAPPATTSPSPPKSGSAAPPSSAKPATSPRAASR